MKVSDARQTSLDIDRAREIYRPAAARASALYFILNDLHRINPMYQFSLKAFSVVSIDQRYTTRLSAFLTKLSLTAV